MHSNANFHFSSWIAKQKPHWPFHRTIFKIMKPVESFCENKWKAQYQFPYIPWRRKKTKCTVINPRMYIIYLYIEWAINMEMCHSVIAYWLHQISLNFLCSSRLLYRQNMLSWDVILVLQACVQSTYINRYRFYSNL